MSRRRNRRKFVRFAERHGAQPIVADQDNENHDEDAYGRFHITPEVKARADAEWAAMDWRGRLPEGWTYEPAVRP